MSPAAGDSLQPPPSPRQGKPVGPGSCGGRSRRGWLGIYLAVAGKAVPGVSYCPGNSSAPWLLPEPTPSPSAVPHGHSAGAGGSGRHSPALPALPRERWGTTGCLCLPHHGQTWLAPVSPQVVLGTGDTSLPAPVPVPGVPVWPSCQASSARQDPLPGLRWALSLARVWGGLTAPTALRTLPTWPAAPTQLLLMTTPYITMATGTEGTEGWGPGIPLQ